MPVGPTTLTLNGITANVLIDGYKKSRSLLNGGPSRTILYDVAWADSDNFIDALLGGAISWAGPGAPIIWPTPHRYPGNTLLVCLEASGSPIGPIQPDGGAKLLAGDRCFVEAHYGVPPIDIFGLNNNSDFTGYASPWVRDTSRMYVHSYPVPASVLTFKSDGTATVKPKELYLPHVEFTRHRYMVPFLFEQLFLTLAYSVNNGTFLWFNKGTLRYESYEASDWYPASDGTLVTDMTMTLTWRPFDWNAELRTDTPITWDVVWDGTNYVYPYADLSPLLNVGLGGGS